MTEIVPHAERKHLRLSASKMPIRAHCSGSMFLEEQLPPDTTPNEASARGTKLHECTQIITEDFLEHKISGTDPDLRGHLLASLDPEDLDACYQARELLWNGVLNQSITGKIFGFEEEWILNTELEIGGISDFWSVHYDDRAKCVLTLVDFKFGFHEVEADDNAQLATYLASMRKELRDAGKYIDYFRGCIIQPSASLPLRISKYSHKELDTWEKKFYRLADQVFVKKKPKFKVGDWCRWCRGKVICKAYNKAMMGDTSLEAIDITETLPEVNPLDDETIRKIALNADKLIAYIGAQKNYALQRHFSGNPIPGLKVVEGGSRRKWISNEAVSSQLDSILETEELYNLKPKGLTVVAAILVKKVGKHKAGELLNPLITKGPAKPILTSIDDPRPAVDSHVTMLAEDAIDDGD